MSIRAAKLTDLNDISLLSKELGYDEVSQEVAKNRLEIILRSNNDELWIWEDENQIKGCILHSYY